MRCPTGEDPWARLGYKANRPVCQMPGVPGARTEFLKKGAVWNASKRGDKVSGGVTVAVKGTFVLRGE